MNDTTEWLRVMLGEIERKRQQEREALAEAERREQDAPADTANK